MLICSLYALAQKALHTLVICSIMVVLMVSYNLLLHNAWSISNLCVTAIHMFSVAYFLEIVVMSHLVPLLIHKINRPKQKWIYPIINVGLMAICCSGAALFAAVGLISGFFVMWVKAFIVNCPVALVLVVCIAKPIGDKVLARR